MTETAQRQFWDAQAVDYQRLAGIRTDDFHYGPLLPGERELKRFADKAPPGKALELGCGGAQNSLWLAAHGWQCTAIDVSAAQLAHAAALSRRLKLKLERIHLALEHLTPDVLDGPFNLIHSVHALQFLRDPFRLLRKVARCLAPGGRLVLAVQHPLFAGEWLELAAEGFGLFLPHYFRPPPDVRSAPEGTQIASRSWPVSRWFTEIQSLSLTIEALLEPAALPESRLHEAPYPGGDAWRALYPQLRRIPSTLIVIATKPLHAA